MNLNVTIDMDALPEKFPTHRHEALFWESLGRAVATFGFLEEVLGKAIFAFTATRRYDESEVQQAYEEWLPKMERALTDPLGNLIDMFGKAVREHPCSTDAHLEQLLSDLRNASSIRNVLCHASWRLPNGQGASIPFFVNRRMEIFDSEIDCRYLDQMQRHVAELACSVMNNVTVLGWQFPGSSGPGEPISMKKQA